MKRKPKVLKAPEIITAARRLIVKDVGWDDPALQSADAVDHNGEPVFITDPRAVRFSITGALLFAGRDSDWDELALALNAVAKAVGATTTVEESTARTVQCIWAWEDAPGVTVGQVHYALGVAWQTVAA